MQNILHAQEFNSLKKLLALIVILVLGLAGYLIFTQAGSRDQRIGAGNDKERTRNNIMSYVAVEKNDYKFNSHGGISDLILTISNQTDYLLENVRVEVTYIKVNGDVWRKKNIDFEMLSPKSTGIINMEDTDRGTSVDCRIISIKSTALGL